MGKISAFRSINREEGRKEENQGREERKGGERERERFILFSSLKPHTCVRYSSDRQIALGLLTRRGGMREAKSLKDGRTGHDRDCDTYTLAGPLSRLYKQE